MQRVNVTCHMWQHSKISWNLFIKFSLVGGGQVKPPNGQSDSHSYVGIELLWQLKRKMRVKPPCSRMSVGQEVWARRRKTMGNNLFPRSSSFFALLHQVSLFCGHSWRKCKAILPPMAIMPFRPIGLLHPEHHNIIYDDHLIGLVPILGQSIKNQGWKEKFRVKINLRNYSRSDLILFENWTFPCGNNVYDIFFCTSKFNNMSTPPTERLQLKKANKLDCRH